ncbi:MAG: hypothetical protein AAGD07_23620 [Planctomycetota bacterium]
MKQSNARLIGHQLRPERNFLDQAAELSGCLLRIPNTQPTVFLPRFQKRNHVAPETVVGGHRVVSPSRRLDEALACDIEIPAGLKDLTDRDFAAISDKALKEARWFYAVPRRMNRAQCTEILADVAAAAEVDACNQADPHTLDETRHSRRQMAIAV